MTAFVRYVRAVDVVAAAIYENARGGDSWERIPEEERDVWRPRAARVLENLGWTADLAFPTAEPDRDHRLLFTDQIFDAYADALRDFAMTPGFDRLASIAYLSLLDEHAALRRIARELGYIDFVEATRRETETSEPAS